MKVASQSTRFGELKGSKDGIMFEGPPIFSLTANKDGLMVRLSNLEFKKKSLRFHEAP